LKFSVIILSFNRREELRETLETVLETTYRPLEVIVVDNASSDDSVAMVLREFPSVRILPLEQNIGIAGYNIGVEHSSGDVVVLLDDDSAIETDALESVCARLENSPDVGCVAFRISLRGGQVVTCTWGEEVPSFWGCGAAIRRSVWDATGGYDEDFFLYLNEIDLAIRIWAQGFRVVYAPECHAVHRVAKSNRASGRLVRYSARNAVWFHLKHVPWLWLPRTLAADLLSYFWLALLGGCLGDWAKGVTEGFEMRHLALRKRRAVDAGVLSFYRKNAFMWQSPLRQLWVRRGSRLNTRPSDV